MQKTFLRLLFIFGLLLFLPLIRRKPSKEMNEWLIVFFTKGYISSILDTIVYKMGYIKYPINLFKFFNISVLFSYLLYPLACVYFNQVTKNSNMVGILIKVLLFSIPMTIAEFFLEKKTNLIKYCKGWNSMVSFITLNLTFLLVRGFMAAVRKLNKEVVHVSSPE
jgi:hypothetical protein